MVCSRGGILPLPAICRHGTIHSAGQLTSQLACQSAFHTGIIILIIAGALTNASSSPPPTVYGIRLPEYWDELLSPAVETITPYKWDDNHLTRIKA